jgi:hypothetical protein
LLTDLISLVILFLHLIVFSFLPVTYRPLFWCSFLLQLFLWCNDNHTCLLYSFDAMTITHV